MRDCISCLFISPQCTQFLVLLKPALGRCVDIICPVLFSWTARISEFLNRGSSAWAGIPGSFHLQMGHKDLLHMVIVKTEEDHICQMPQAMPDAWKVVIKL